jgi:hypothetical protein
MYQSLKVILEEEQKLDIYPDPNKLVRKFDQLSDSREQDQNETRLRRKE